MKTGIENAKSIGLHTVCLLIAAGWVKPSAAGDIESYELDLGQQWVQIGNFLPTLGTGSVYSAEAYVVPWFPSFVSSISIVTPPGVTNALAVDLTGTAYDFSYGTTSAQIFDPRYPLGDYFFAFDTVSDGQRMVTVSFTGSQYPNTPQILNLVEGQTIKPGQDFVLTWAAFAGAGADDGVRLMVSDDAGITVLDSGVLNGPNSLPGTATAFTIPAGTLQDGKTYTAQLLFYKVAQKISAVLETGWGILFKSTQFSLHAGQMSVPVDTTPPELSVSQPTNNAVDVPPATPVYLRFSEFMRPQQSVAWSPNIDPAKVNCSWADSQTLLMYYGNISSPSWPTNATITWKLNPNAGDTNNLQDLAGNPLPPGQYSGTFSTTSSILTNTNPSGNAHLQMRWVPKATPEKFAIQLQAEAGPAYTIEQSTNLVDWHPVLSGPMSNGVLELTNVIASGSTRAFYRGRLGSATNTTSTSLVVLDMNRAASTLVSRSSGGSLALTNEAGVRITFTVGPSNVLQTVPVTMTLVRELTGLPETESPPVAVQFEPDGYEFSGSGTLEILYPTNLTVLAMSSFAFSSDGRDSYFIPDQVETNRVVIDISHFSGAGTAPWTRAGRQQMQAHTPIEARDAAAKAFGDKLAQVRQAQRDGGTDPTTREQWFQLADNLWLAEILSRGGAAATDCGQAQALARNVRAIEGYLRTYAGVTGYTGKYLDYIRTNGIALAWVCNCVREAFAFCRDGDVASSGERYQDAEDVRQTFGVKIPELQTCVSELNFTNVTDLEQLNHHPPCVGWQGELSFISDYQATYDDDAAIFHEHQYTHDAYIYRGTVVKGTLISKDGQGNLEYEIEFKGTATLGHYKKGTNEDKSDTCKKKVTWSELLEPQKSVQTAKVHLYLRVNEAPDEVIDFIEVILPTITKPYDWVQQTTYDRSSDPCNSLHPTDNPPWTGTSNWSESPFYETKFMPTQFTQNSWPEYEAQGDFSTDVSKDPYIGKYMTGGRRTVLYLHLSGIK